MLWNQYLSNAMMALVLIIPAAILTCKIAWPKIPSALLVSPLPIVSWLVSSAVFSIYPREMGFGAALVSTIGWSFMPVVLVALSPIYFFNSAQWNRSPAARCLALALVILAAGLPIHATFRRIPESTAIVIASGELQWKGWSDVEIEGAEKDWNGWIIYVSAPSQNIYRYPVYLSRSGFCYGTGD